MPQITRSKDCRNSPKNQLVEDLSIALAAGDPETISKLVDNDSTWEVVGKSVYSSCSEIVEAVVDRIPTDLESVVIAHAFTHGKQGAVYGQASRRSGVIVSFCDVFEFTSVKGTHVKSIRSFMIAK